MFNVNFEEIQNLQYIFYFSTFIPGSIHEKSNSFHCEKIIGIKSQVQRLVTEVIDKQCGPLATNNILEILVCGPFLREGPNMLRVYLFDR